MSNSTRPEASQADNVRDAVAWLEATIHGDRTGKVAIAENCDPVGLVDALTGMYLGLAALTMHPLDWDAFFTHIRAAIAGNFSEDTE